MAAMRWSSDFILGEYKDVHANSISLDSTGTYLLLPGRKQLTIKNLNEPIDEIHSFSRVSKYEIGAVAWSPHSFNQELCALCVGPRIELLTWRNKNELFTNSLLRSHSRSVTDIDWQPVDPNTLISSSLDNLTHVWDIRECRKPVISFSSFAGASHVRWNKLSRHLLATTYSGDIKIWDERKNSSPIRYITASSKNVYSIDWSTTKENQLSAAVQDGSIRIFDITDPQKTSISLMTADEAPVWKVCYTPFGNGNSILGVVIPEMKISENSLLLWHLSKIEIPLHTFIGNTEIVLDYQWRNYQQDGSDYQLITWSKDKTLRIWEIDRNLQQLSGQEKIDIRHNGPMVSSSSTRAPYKTSSTITTIPYTNRFGGPTLNEIKEQSAYFRVLSEMTDIYNKSRESTTTSQEDKLTIGENENNDVPTNTEEKSNGTETDIDTKGSLENLSIIDEEASESTKLTAMPPKNLQQEFECCFNIKNVEVSKMDLSTRMCNASAQCNGFVVSLWINFPAYYPRKKRPGFRFAPDTTVNMDVKTKLLQVLKDTAGSKVMNNEVCLEECLTQLVSVMQQILPDDPEKYSDFASDGTSYHNSEEPYVIQPRTSGAKFCHIGYLVCFIKPKPVLIAKNISGFGGSSFRHQDALSRLYIHNQGTLLPPRTRLLIRRGLLKRVQVCANIHRRRVHIFDMGELFYPNKMLAQNYIFTGKDIAAICRRNADLANSAKRPDLVDMWKLASLIASYSTPNDQECRVDWQTHPFAKNMIDALIKHYSSVPDAQTASMLCCIFAQRKSNLEFEKIGNGNIPVAVMHSGLHNRKWWYKPGGSPYHTVQPLETTPESSWNFPIRKQHRSNSWSEYLDDPQMDNTIEHGEIIETTEISTNNDKIVKEEDPYENIKILYANLLDRWQLLGQRALVVKNIKSPPVTHRGVEFVTECSRCKNQQTGKICPNCKIPTLICIICRLSVKGSANFCLACGHGGHTVHMKQWFKTSATCPSGCKCQCLIKTAMLFQC